MENFYSVKYTDDRDGLTLVSITPHSNYIEEMFYNGSLLKDVHLGDIGNFSLDLWLSEDGDFRIEGKFKYCGWLEVKI